MKIGIIRIESMAVERTRVLQRLCGNGDAAYESTLTEMLISEENLYNEMTTTQIASFLSGLSVVFIAVPGAYAFNLAQQAVKQGVHTFLGRSATPSISESNAIATLGEEAGAEIGVSRPMRYHPFYEMLPANWHASQLTVHHTNMARNRSTFQQMLEDAVDLCCSLSGVAEVHRVEAQVMHDGLKQPDSLLTGFRFQNGTYAQIQLRQGAPRSGHTLFAAGSGFQMEVDLEAHVIHVLHSTNDENEKADPAFESKLVPARNLVEIETIAYLKALAGQKPIPISITEGLQTLQLVERIRKRLR